MAVKEPKIREVYTPSDEEKAKIRKIYDRYRDMRESDDRTKAEKVWDKAEKDYETWRENKGKDQWQSNHVVPMTFSIVETALSEIVKQNTRPIILPRGKEDVAKAKIMSYIWDYAWEVSDGDMQLYNVVKDALMFGTGIAQEYYWQDKRLITNTSLGKDNKEEKKEHEVYAYDDVYMEVVRLQDFFVDEKARGFVGPYGARDCVRRYIMNIEDFQAFFKGDIWDPLGNAKYVVPGGDINYYEFYTPPKGIDESKEVEVLWYWSVKPEDKLIIVANDILIKDGPNPYKHKSLPFVRFVDVKRVHRFYGKGEPEILESMKDEATTLRRMIIDRNHLDIDKMFLVSKSLGLSDEDLIARPHGMIPTDDVNGAKPVEYGDIPRSVEASLKYLEDDATISTGINPRAQAMPTAGTATEAAILKESTLRRIEMKLWLMKRESLVQLARLRVANILQFYSQPKLEKIVGEQNSQTYQNKLAELQRRGLLVEVDKQKYAKEYKQIRLEDNSLDTDDKGTPEINSDTGIHFFELRPDYFVPVSRGGYDIKFDTSVNIEISKPLMRDQSLQLFDRFMQVATTVPGSYDPVKIGDSVLEDFDKDPNDFKPENPAMDEKTAFLDTLIKMASMENQQMMAGQMVPATPNASPIHTRVHAEFINSPDFQDPAKVPAESPIVKNFTDHIMGELMAQSAREQIPGGSQVPPPQPEPQLMGQPTTQGGMSQGKVNKPGGMAPTKTKISNVLPNLNTGGNK